VYVVLRASSGRPEFLAVGGGGWWKGNDPTVSIERLESRWVDGTPTLYIGKAKSLRDRVGELLRFSDGEAVRHRGGRLLWQLGGAQDFLLGWREEPDFGGVETDLIDEFLDHFGQLPFAKSRPRSKCPLAALSGSPGGLAPLLALTLLGRPRMALRDPFDLGALGRIAD
jgi:hypothetical protein